MKILLKNFTRFCFLRDVFARATEKNLLRNKICNVQDDYQEFLFFLKLLNFLIRTDGYEDENASQRDMNGF